ncbi:MAG TPA: UDP-3-O-(3-hydroxymyristoyl)glucosamine N-acyltransferase [Rhodospirillaceae bacterium]|nr:UDP-3-O-(3-hydroxymyristoyl)glucosamine N-acyltransferase [Rhodospirillaceae bacterium]
MADPRFFQRAGPFTLGELASRSGALVADGADPSRLLTDVAAVDVAGPEQITFLDNRKYVDAFRQTRAGACLVDPKLAYLAPAGVNLLLASDPYRAYALVAQAFYPVPVPQARVAEGCVVDPTAVLGTGVQIDPGAVIGARAELGDFCRIGANAVIGPGVVLGSGCIIGAGATLSHCLVGNNVNIYPGARIGQDGFGFAMGPGGHLKVPQLGRVIIEDEVEIGANTTIDRGAGPDTVIGAGSKIDNLVQIGHNVRIGRGCVIVAQAGISGSTRLDDFVAVGGQVGVTGHLHIGMGARLGAQSGVMRDVPAGMTVGGSPATSMTEWLRQNAILAKLARKGGSSKE